MDKFKTYHISFFVTVNFSFLDLVTVRSVFASYSSAPVA